VITIHQQTDDMQDRALH